MILVVAAFEVAPTDREQFVAVRHSQVLEALARPGCLDYSLALDAFSEGVVRLVECWETPEAFAFHLAEHEAAGGPPAQVAVRSRSVTMYDATLR